MLTIIWLMALNSDTLVESKCTVDEVPEDFTVTPVTICSTGIYRKEQEKNCTNSSKVFHCLPDLNGNLYEFCGRSRKDLSYSYFVLDRANSLHFNNLVFPISLGTETEFYSNFSQLILEEDPQLDGLTIFTKLREEVNNTSTVSCIDDLKEHFLPSRDTCKVVSACVRPQHVPWISIYLLEVRGDIGSFIIKCFPMPQTNTNKYSLVALTLCRDNHSTLRKQCSTLQENKKDCQEGNKKDCQEGNKTDCQEGNTTGLIICVIFTCLIVSVPLSLAIENYCHLIDKLRSIYYRIIERRQQSENHKSGKYGHPSDAFQCNQQSNVVSLATGPRSSSQI